ncbi:MAG: VCBS repeat-containing protein [Planctomycetota bacterium]
MLSGLIAGLLAALPQSLPPEAPPQAPEAAVQPSSGGGRVGGTTQAQPSRLEFPDAPSVDRFPGFVDASGAPLAAQCAAAGSADFDGDGNVDFWMLGASGPASGQLAFHLARTSSLGRFRPWNVYAKRGWLDGATFKSTDYTLGDRVMLVDPQTPTLISAHYSYPYGGNPRAGVFAVNAAWQIGLGAYEIETREDENDGHDDIGVLLAVPGGGTEIRKLRMTTSAGWLSPEPLEIRAFVPLPARRLRLLDFDGDARTDALIEVPGIGLLLYRDDGTRFVPTHVLPFPWPISDLIAGDVNRDGLHDFAIVVPEGIALAVSQGGNFTPLALPRPASTGPIAAARILGERRGLLTSIVALAANGRATAVYPALGGTRFGAPELRSMPATGAFAGSGPGLAPAVVGDLDNDGDDDLVAPLPDRAHWLRLLNPETDLRPTSVTFVDRGKIGETGYRKFDMVVRVPPAAIQRGLTELEIGVFVQDTTLVVPRYVYWGRLLGPVDPKTRLARFEVYSQQNTLKLIGMLQQRTVHPYPGGISMGGEASISIHFKEPSSGSQGTRRYASRIAHHEGDKAGQQSAVGVKWRVRAEVPKPTVDDDLLPWN